MNTVIESLEAIKRQRLERESTLRLWKQEGVYDCPECRDKGVILINTETEFIARKCPKCFTKRLFRNSGLTEIEQNTTFNNFIPDSSNQKVYEAIKKYSITFSDTWEKNRRSKGFGLTGAVGTGKSHLALASANNLIDRGVQVIFVYTPDLMEELKEAQFSGYGENLNAKIHALGMAEMVIFDDIGKEKITDWVRNQYNRIINKRWTKALPTAFTSNLNLDQLAEEERLGDAAVSRLFDLVADNFFIMEGEDYRLKNWLGAECRVHGAW